MCLEIEMVAHDIESIWTTLNGNTIRSLDNGIVTVYNDKGEIFTQHEFYTLKDNYNHTDKYEVKKIEKVISVTTMIVMKFLIINNFF